MEVEGVDGAGAVASAFGDVEQQPPLVVAEELAGLPGVEQAFILGSWAARYDG